MNITVNNKDMIEFGFLLGVETIVTCVSLVRLHQVRKELHKYRNIKKVLDKSLDIYEVENESLSRKVIELKKELAELKGKES